MSMLPRHQFLGSDPPWDKCYTALKKITGELVTTVVLIPLFSTKDGPGFDSQPGAICAFGFQSTPTSAGFSPGTPVFLLYLKLSLDNSPSFSAPARIWEAEVRVNITISVPI